MMFLITCFRSTLNENAFGSRYLVRCTLLCCQRDKSNMRHSWKSISEVLSGDSSQSRLFRSKFRRSFTDDLKIAQFGGISSLVNHFPGCLLLGTLPHDAMLICISGYSEAGANLAQVVCMDFE